MIKSLKLYAMLAAASVVSTVCKPFKKDKTVTSVLTQFTKAVTDLQTVAADNRAEVNKQMEVIVEANDRAQVAGKEAMRAEVIAANITKLLDA